jgi:peptidoglycan/xylan/chitin deacetylase (PgdA/CDA1 family)
MFLHPRSLVVNAAHHLGLLALAGNFSPLGVTIVMFHGVVDDSQASNPLNSLGLHLAESPFARLCKGLANTGMVVSLEQAVAALQGKRVLRQHEIVLTFDDGYRNNYTHAFPLLKKYQLPATVFLATEFLEERVPLWPDRVAYAVMQARESMARVTFENSAVDLALDTPQQRRDSLITLCREMKELPQETLSEACKEVEYQLTGEFPELAQFPDFQHPLAWAECREMLASGLVSFGAHTHRHLILGRCQPETVHGEMQRNMALMEENLGQKVTTFAYPNGKTGDHSEATKAVLASLGIETALTTELGRNIPATADPLRLYRYVPKTTAHAVAMANGLPELKQRWFV